MIHIVPVMARAVPSLNESEQSEFDFERLCERIGIKFRFTRLVGVDGVYAESKGKRYIFVDDRLRGFRRVFTAFHELGHAILHETRCCSSHEIFERRDEYEADLFAMLALLPRALLGTFIYMQNSRRKFERTTFNQRMRVYYDYGL